MNRKNGRILAAVEMVVLAGVVGIAVCVIAGRCAGGVNDVCAFAPVSRLWEGLLDTGVMLAVGALLATTFSRIDGILRVTGRSKEDNGKRTGD